MHKPRKQARERSAKRRQEEHVLLRIRNDHGYSDPTPYFALRNIEATRTKATTVAVKPGR